MKKFVSILLAVALLVTVFAGCGKNNENIAKAQVTYPVPTDAEAVVDTAAGLSIQYYLTGRAYLDEFLNYDVSTLTQENYAEYTALVDNAVKAFENSDKVNAVLNEALDKWEQTETELQAPTAEAAHIVPFGAINAYAAPEMGSKEWAQSIMDEYAKAKPGYAIRHLASQLGTDAKHAYAQMKMAQDILMGAEYTQIADKANTAVKTATVLKTAGTGAQLVIAVATAPASGALATAVSTGGITISGVNTVLEIGSTASILYTNGDDNEFSMACDKTEAQLAPIGQIFAIAGIGANIKDLAGAGKDIWKNGYKSLSSQAQQDLGMNTFGVISYGAGAINDYVNGGSILSGTFTKDDDGVKFTLWNTLTGTDPEQQSNVKEVLKNAGIPEKDIEDALKTAAENGAQGAQNDVGNAEQNTKIASEAGTTAAPQESTTAAATQPSNSTSDQNVSADTQPTGTMSTDNIDPEVAKNIIQNTKPIMDDDFDLDSYLNKLREILYEIASLEVDEDETATETTTAETTTESVNFLELICGTYEMSGTLVVDMKGASPKSESRDFTVNVSDAGDGNITVSVEDEKNSFTETAKLDEGNKSASFDTTVSTEYAAFTYNCKITFDTSGGDPSAELTILLGNKGSEDGYAEIIVSGPKS